MKAGFFSSEVSSRGFRGSQSGEQSVEALRRPSSGKAWD